MIASSLRRILCTTCALVGSGTTLMAADVADPPMNGSPMVIGQLLAGTSGFEPGIALEWHCPKYPAWFVRPEVSISEDGRPGVGVSIDRDVTAFDLPEGQSLAFGPRIVYHNSDRSGWEADALGIYRINIVPSHGHHHYIEILGALGILQDKDHSPDQARFGATIGAAYGYRF